MLQKSIICALLCLSCFVSAQSVKFGKVTEEALKETAHPTEPEAPASVLYRYTFTKFDYNQDKGFILKTEVQERIKIYNKEGYDWATQEVPMYQGGRIGDEGVTSFKAYTYNFKDGKIEKTKLKGNSIFKEEKNENLKLYKFTFPDVQDGSIIEYSYTFTSPFISNINTYRFQERIPVNKVEMTAYIPEYLVYKTHGKGWFPYQIEREQRNRKLRWRYERDAADSDVIKERGTSERDIVENVYRVAVENVPSITEESYSGNIDNYMSGLDLELSLTKFPGAPVEYYSSTWEDVVNRIYKSDGFGKEMERTKYFRDDIDALKAQYADPAKLTMAIYEFVKQRMSWNEYYGVYADQGLKKAFDSKVGNVADINLMLTAMLKYAGLSANPVLISTKKNGIPMFPTRTGFNYVISAVRLGDGVVLLDAADKNGSPNILKADLLNWRGYIVKEDGSSRTIGLLPTKPATHSAFMNIAIDETLETSGKVQNRYTGHYARNKRNLLGTLSEDEAVTKLEEKLDAFELAEVSFKERTNPYKPFTEVFNFEAEDGIEEIAGKLYIDPLQHLKIDENPFKTEKRNYPVDFIYPWLDRYTVAIKIPEGYAVEFLPESAVVNLSNNVGSFKYNISEMNGEIKLSVQHAINKQMIGPDMYGDLKAFFQYIVDKESEKIVLKKV